MNVNSLARKSQDYWTDYNVTEHKAFTSLEESVSELSWRNSQYFDYEKLMPVGAADGMIVLDYGCGPGHDLVGFGLKSRPAALIGADVSGPSLNEASERLALHGFQAKLFQLGAETVRLPLASASVDLIHCSGVLHHVPCPQDVLTEFRRLLKPGGVIQLMTYNYFSVWMHLYAAYSCRFETHEGKGLTLEEAFRRSTDTPDCPISVGWRPAEVMQMCADAGLKCEHLGNATAVQELEVLKNARFRAIACKVLEPEHRDFLRALTFDDRGIPYFGGHAAGIDACFRAGSL